MSLSGGCLTVAASGAVVFGRYPWIETYLSSLVMLDTVTAVSSSAYEIWGMILGRKPLKQLGLSGKSKENDDWRISIDPEKATAYHLMSRSRHDGQTPNPDDFIRYALSCNTKTILLGPLRSRAKEGIYFGSIEDKALAMDLVKLNLANGVKTLHLEYLAFSPDDILAYLAEKRIVLDVLTLYSVKAIPATLPYPANAVIHDNTQPPYESSTMKAGEFTIADSGSAFIQYALDTHADTITFLEHVDVPYSTLRAFVEAGIIVFGSAKVMTMFEQIKGSVRTSAEDTELREEMKQAVVAQATEIDQLKQQVAAQAATLDNLAGLVADFLTGPG